MHRSLFRKPKAAPEKEEDRHTAVAHRPNHVHVPAEDNTSITASKLGGEGLGGLRLGEDALHNPLPAEV